MHRGNCEKLCPNQPPPALVHTKFFRGNPPPRDPPIPPPHYWVLSSPPAKEKRRHGKHKTPRLENNCTPVVDSRGCDNFKLILILVI